MCMEHFIDRIMADHDISFIDLVNRLGYRSKTSLERIIKGTVRPDTIRRFEQAMVSAFDLSAEEKALLTECVQKSIYGEEQYRVHQAMLDFIQGCADTGKALRIIDLQTGQEIDMGAFCGRFRAFQLTIVNCQYVNALFDHVHLLLQQGNVTVQHFIYDDDDDVRTIRSTSALMPLFYEKGYMGYIHRRNSIRDQDSGWNDGDWVIASMVDAEGGKRSFMILFTDSESGTLMEIPFMDEERIKRMGLDKQLCRPIKRQYFDCGAFEDYVTYSSNYAALERNRTVLKIKPDIGVDQIPAWILKKAVQEGPVPADDQFSEVLDRLEAVYRERYRNSFTKHRHCHTIMKRGAMRRFALKGKTTDHFWMMRPFTPGERAIILTELLRQQQENPYVHFYFLKDDSALRDVEIAYYEGEGMLILDAETDYNLEQGHSEMMITHERMLSIFKQCFYGSPASGLCVHGIGNGGFSAPSDL